MSNSASSIIYLLAGNSSSADWWRDALPYFQCKRPMPVELPGFGDTAILFILDRERHGGICANRWIYSSYLEAPTGSRSASFIFQLPMMPRSGRFVICKRDGNV